MDPVVKKFLHKAAPLEGAVLFGSQLTNPTPTSDTDIVLFGCSSKVAHSIEHYKNRVFDVFRVSVTTTTPCGVVVVFSTAAV